jgi:dCTP deaminase
MILTGPKIKNEVVDGTITISPFEDKYINPNSYDFRLGNTLVIYKNNILDAREDNETELITISEEGYTLQPNILYLAHTMEKIGSNHYVPILRGKSSTGRMGLFINITADLIDIGSLGCFTLMLHAVQPLKVYPGMRIGQVTFWEVTGKINLYDGKYQGTTTPRASQAFKDFK